MRAGTQAAFTIDASALSFDYDGGGVDSGSTALQGLTSVTFSYDGDGAGGTESASATEYNFDVSSVQSTNASDFAAALNANADFSANFVAGTAAAGADITITAKVTDDGGGLLVDQR